MTGGHDKKLRVWSINSTNPTPLFDITEPGNVEAIEPLRNNVVATGGSDFMVRKWNIETAKQIGNSSAILDGQVRSLQLIYLSSSDCRLAVGVANKKIYILKVNSLATLQILSTNQNVNDLEMLYENRVLVSAHTFGFLQFWAKGEYSDVFGLEYTVGFHGGSHIFALAAVSSSEFVSAGEDPLVS